MKKIGEHLKILGFNPDASEDAKKAFIKYLMRESSFHDRVSNFYKYKEVISKELSKMAADDCKIGEQLTLFDKVSNE